MPSAPTSRMMRVAKGGRNGATAFFRNRPLLEAIVDYLNDAATGPLRVLVHACSIGAEAYSLIIHRDVEAARRDVAFTLTVDATDISPDFVAVARMGAYPLEALSNLTPDEQARFEAVGDAKARPILSIREQVRFLPAKSYVEFVTDQTYDVVILNNALVYVDGEAQGRTFDAIAGYNSNLLVTTGFHMDRIKADMVRNGYQPVTDRIADIHNSWTERLKIDKDQAWDDSWATESKIDWRLDPFSEIEDFDYKYCALFRKTA